MHVGFFLEYVALASIPIAHADSASLACGKVSSQGHTGSAASSTTTLNLTLTYSRRHGRCGTAEPKSASLSV